MTCIAFDGKTLAVDSRITSTRGNRASDNGLKLIDVTSPLYMHRAGKPTIQITQVAGTGDADAVWGMIDLLVKDPDNFRKTVRTLRDSRLMDPKISYSIVLVGEGRVFVFGSQDSYAHELKPQDKGPLRVAFGSGGKVAEWLMQTYGVSAPMAVAGAAITDQFTGGVIHGRTYTKGKQALETENVFLDINTLRKQLQDHIAAYKVPSTRLSATTQRLAARLDSMMWWGFVSEPSKPRRVGKVVEKPQDPTPPQPENDETDA